MRIITDVRLPQKHCTTRTPDVFSINLDDNNVVRSVNQTEPGETLCGESWSGDWLSPMGIDLQINGGMGLWFSELAFEDLPILYKLLDELWRDGIEAICPTIVSCKESALRRSLSVIEKARGNHKKNRCQLLGSHLEGPFIASERRGAHSSEYLCEPSISALERRIRGYESQIDLVTLAPELPGSAVIISKLRDLGILVSLGHSNADARTARWAFELGITMLTHTFNAMNGLHHRELGPIGEAVNHGRVSMGLIADGVHINPQMVVFLTQVASHQLFLVSDALAPYGLNESSCKWQNRQLNVVDGTCTLEDGTLAGVAFPLLEGSRKLAKWGVDPNLAISCATISPREILFGRRRIKDYLIGKDLGQLLRWRFNSSNFELKWHRAD